MKTASELFAEICAMVAPEHHATVKKLVSDALRSNRARTTVQVGNTLLGIDIYKESA